MASITTELVETGAKRDERGRKITTPAERAWSRPGSRLCGMYSSGRRPPIRESCDRVICRNGEQSDAAGDNVRDPDAWQMRMPGVAARRPAPSEPDTAPLRNRIALGGARDSRLDAYCGAGCAMETRLQETSGPEGIVMAVPLVAEPRESELTSPAGDRVRSCLPMASGRGQSSANCLPDNQRNRPLWTGCSSPIRHIPRWSGLSHQQVRP